jgi:hypothetical protein
MGFRQRLIERSVESRRISEKAVYGTGSKILRKYPAER